MGRIKWTKRSCALWFCLWILFGFLACLHLVSKTLARTFHFANHWRQKANLGAKSVSRVTESQIGGSLKDKCCKEEWQTALARARYWIRNISVPVLVVAFHFGCYLGLLSCCWSRFLFFIYMYTFPCLHIYIYTNIYIYIHIHIYTENTCIHIFIYSHLHIYIYL